MMHPGVIEGRLTGTFNTRLAILKKDSEKASEGTFSPLVRNRSQSITKIRQKASVSTDILPDRKTMKGCMLPISAKGMASKGFRVGKLSVGSGERAIE
jgi:hypothetical protein